MHEIHCIILGRVQQVGFRDYVQRSADAASITGWVRNLSDGTVELVAQGTTDILREFIEALNEGSLGSSVEGVSVEWRTAKDGYEDFSIRHE